MVIKSYHIILAVKILGWFLLKWAGFVAFWLEIVNPIWQHCYWTSVDDLDQLDIYKQYSYKVHCLLGAHNHLTTVTHSINLF